MNENEICDGSGEGAKGWAEEGTGVGLEIRLIMQLRIGWVRVSSGG